MVAYTIIYSSAANSIQSNYILNVACDFFIPVHVCSGKIHLYDLQKFNSETCTEKPEVDIMMLLLVAKAQVIQCNVTKNNFHIQLITR